MSCVAHVVPHCTCAMRPTTVAHSTQRTTPPWPAATSKPSGCAHKAALTRLRSQGCAHNAAFTSHKAALTRAGCAQGCAHKAGCAHNAALTTLRSQDCAHKAALKRLRMIEGSGFSIVVFRTGQLLSSLPIIRFLLHCFQNALVNGKIL